MICHKFLFILISFWGISILLSAEIFAENSLNFKEDYQKALRLAGRQDYETAIEALQKIIRTHPDFSDAFRKLATFYVVTERLAEGKAFFKEILQHQKDNPYAYYALAQLDYQSGYYQKAIDELKKCISLDPEFADAYGPEGGLPDVYQAAGKLREGEAYFKTMMQNFPQNANVLLGLGQIFYHQYNFDKSLQTLYQALKINPDLMQAYFSIFVIHRLKMEYDKALQSGQKLLETARKFNNVEMTGLALLRIGQIYYFLGNYQKALSYMHRANNIAIEIGDIAGEAKTLNDIGSIYAFLGQHDKGLVYLKRALDLFHRLGNIRREIVTQYNIGLTCNDKKDYTIALEYFQKASRLALEKNFKNLNRLIYTGMAEVYANLKDFNRAVEYFNKALVIAQKVGDNGLQGYITRNLGSIHYELGDYANAIKYHQKALQIGKEAKDLQIIWEAHSGLGSAYMKMNQPDLSIHHFATACAIFDSVRQELDMAMLSSAFLNDKYEVYPSIIQLLAKQNKVDEAFSYAEKYRTKNLFNILVSGQSLLADLIPDSIFIRLRQARYQLERLHSELSAELMKIHKDSVKILRLDQRINQIELQKTELLEWVKKNQQSYYQLTSGKPLTVKDIQESILQKGQILLEYVVGKENILVFTITPDSVIFFNIPISRQKLESKLAELSSLFRSKNHLFEKRNELIWNADIADFSVGPAFQLYELLIKPVEFLIQEAKELIIIPDDLLFYLPFEALIFDTTGIENRYDFTHAHFLIEKYAISYASSVAALSPQFNVYRSPELDFFAMANPIIKMDDLYFEQDSLSSSETFQRKYYVTPLKNAESEVKNIGKILKSDSDLIYTREKAKESIFKEKAPKAKIIHLATHFLNNDRQPLYSKLILTPDESRGEEDGLLQTYEIFNLELSAKIVVLSTCNSALGQLNKGEGIVGITRAFLYAGVPSLVVSLWNVEDESTRLIMENFYRYLKKGWKKNHALRMAKIDYMKSANKLHYDPFYWASFILVGDWNPIEFPDQKLSHKYLLLIFVLIIFTALIVIKRKRKIHQ